MKKSTNVWIGGKQDSGDHDQQIAYDHVSAQHGNLGQTRADTVIQYGQK